MGIGKPRDVAATNGHIARSSVPSRVDSESIANRKRRETDSVSTGEPPGNINPGDGHGEKDSCRFRHCDDHDRCMGSMHEPHNLQWQPHCDMHNVLLRPQLHDQLLLTMPRKPSEATQKAAKPKSKGKVATSPEDAQKPAKNKVGAPSTFQQHIADVICIRIAEGESLREIIKTPGMPDRSTVYDWLLRHPEFADQYARARDEQADTLADEIIAIADEQPEIIAVVDKKTGALIEHKLDGAFLQWQKNRIDARKWTAMKLKPKKYGERVALAGDADNPIKVEAEVQAENLLSAMLKNVELKKQVDD